MPTTALPGTQRSQRVRSKKHCVIRFRRRGDFHRVPHRHAIGHQHGEFDPRFNRRNRSLFHAGRRHKNDGDIDIA